MIIRTIGHRESHLKTSKIISAIFTTPSHQALFPESKKVEELELA
jgi:hypothetical protein